MATTNETSISSFCRFSTVENWSLVTGFIGLGFTIVLMFTAKRTRLWPNFLNGRPGLIIPVNLLEGRSNRKVYVAAFCSMATTILSLILNATIFHGSNPWTQVLRGIALVLLISMAYTVVVMAIDTPIPIIGHSIGFVYSIWLFSFTVSVAVECSSDILGTAVNVLVQLPIGFLCLLICWFAYQVVKKFLSLRGMNFGTSTISKEDPVPIEWKYVRMKLSRKPIPLENDYSDKTSRLDSFIRFIKSHMYQSDPTFRYSTRILVTTGVTAVCLWQLTVTFTAVGIKLDNLLHNSLDSVESALSKHNLSLDLVEDFKEIVKSIAGCYYAAVSVSSFITVIHLIHLLACYRKHMKRLYRGDTSFLPAVKPGPVGMVTAALRYSGFQVAYTLWGWVILFLVQFLIYFAITFAFRLKIVAFDSLVLGVLPTLTFTLLIFVLQFLLAKFVLLYDRGSYMNIKNRRLFHILSFFFFFYNTLIGLLSCLRRILTGLVLGTLLVDRLDRCTLPRGWEGFDRGFRSYLGFILLEHTYSNPYLVTFLYLLREERAKLTTGDMKQPAELQGVHSNSGQFLNYRSRRIRNRWLVAYTLINNPSLLMLRNRDVDKLEYASLLTRSMSEPGSNRSMSEEALIIEDHKQA